MKTNVAAVGPPLGTPVDSTVARGMTNKEKMTRNAAPDRTWKAMLVPSTGSLVTTYPNQTSAALPATNTREAKPALRLLTHGKISETYALTTAHAT